MNKIKNFGVRMQNKFMLAMAGVHEDREEGISPELIVTIVLIVVALIMLVAYRSRAFSIFDDAMNSIDTSKTGLFEGTHSTTP